MTDIDDRLRDYAQRWQSAQPAPPRPLPAPARLRTRRPNRLVMAAAAAAVIAAVVAVAATRHHDSTQVSTQPPGAVPVAEPPLLHHSLQATSRITLTTGRSGNIAWAFFAEYVTKKDPPGAGPGLCTGFAVKLGSSSGCDDPAGMPALTAEISRLQGDPATLLVTGVTSAPAATFSVTLGTVSLSTPALSSPALPGLRFYVVQLPAAEYPPGAALTVEAVAADGTALLRNDPQRTAPLLPAVTPPEPTSKGPQAIWPSSGAGTAAFGPPSASALAADFATQVLGIPAPTVTATSPAGQIATISIRLPATGQVLKGLAQIQPDRSWALLQLGDQGQLVGVTYSPTSPPAAVMSLAPPTGATQADVIDGAADGTHHLHLTAAELATKTLHLPTGAQVDSIIVIYRDAAGAPVGALAESFS